MIILSYPNQSKRNTLNLYQAKRIMAQIWKLLQLLLVTITFGLAQLILRIPTGYGNDPRRFKSKSPNGSGRLAPTDLCP